MTTFKKLEQRLVANKTYLKNHPIAASRSAMTYIPIKFHLVGEDDGSGRVEYTRVLDQICLLNEVFQEFEISFYIKDGFNEVNDSDIYSNQTASFTKNRMKGQRDTKALDIWVLGEVTTGINSNNTILGVYDSDNDWVRITNNRSYFGLTGYTLPHELGHFFSLLHPFYGWEIEPYDQTLEGKPAPRKAPSFDVLTEHADGSNCEIAGDFICDTPAEYWYPLYVDSRGDTVNNMDNFNCKYTRLMTDSKGERLSPDPSLIMGYFLDNCMDHFTPDQIDIMKADLQRSNRSYLRSNYTPTEGIIESSPRLLAPIDKAVTDNYNQVKLSWEAVANATMYAVELSRLPNFSNPFNYISSTNSITLKELEAGKRYYWRIMPFNETYTCAAPSSREEFRTGLSTSTRTIDSVSDLEIFPNPTTSINGFVLSVQATASFVANMKVFSLTGQLLQQQNDISFAAGTTHMPIDINSLENGMYFIHIENEVGVMNRKFIVSN